MQSLEDELREECCKPARDPELPPSYRDWKHYAKTCSDEFAHMRGKLARQTALRVQADMRAGHKNVAALEARILLLEKRLAAR